MFRGLIASPDGKLFYDTTREGKPEDAVAMGHDAGMELKVGHGCTTRGFSLPLVFIFLYFTDIKHDIRTHVHFLFLSRPVVRKHNIHV